MECKAVRERKALTAALQVAAKPVIGLEILFPAIKGTQEEMVEAFDILHGIVNEYRDGGDQMVEGCDCGEHVPDQEVTMTIPFQLTTVDLKLDPATERGTDFIGVLRSLTDQRPNLDSESWTRILKSTIILQAAGAGTLGECLDTACVWEFG